MNEKLSIEGDGENEKIALISSAQTFEDLYAALDQIGEVQGSRGIISAAELKEKIAFAREAPGLGIGNITNGGDLRIRDKVKSLLETELGRKI